MDLQTFKSYSRTLTAQDCDFENVPSAEPGIVIVDGRCDVNPKAPVGLYLEPTQQSTALGEARSGDVITAECMVKGERIVNSVSSAGDGADPELWVRLKLDVNPVAYVPATWVLGEKALKGCN